MASVAPNASYHFTALSVKGESLDEDKYANNLVFFRNKDFESGNEIETETDEGHTGTANLDMGDYRTNAESQPSWEDKVRYSESWEEILFSLLGTVNPTSTGANNTSGVAVTGADGAYEYNFSFPATNPHDLPYLTIYNGFAKTTTDARIFNNCLMNEFELTCSNEDAPTIKNTFISNYNNMNMLNPTRSFKSDTSFVKSKQVNIYYGNPDDTDATMLTKKMSCFLEATLSINNNFESQLCAGNDFGKNSKFMGVRETTGTLKLPWTDATKQFEPEHESNSSTFATSASTDKNVGHVVSEEILYKKIWFEFVGGYIPKTGSTTEYTTQPFKTLIKLPLIAITKAESPLSGDEAKDLTLEFKAVEKPTQSFMTAQVFTDLSALHVDTTGVDFGTLIPTATS